MIGLVKYLQLLVLAVTSAAVMPKLPASSSSSSSASPPQLSTGVKPLVTVDDRCDSQVQQVQSAVIQMLTTQHEHRRAMDKLQMLTDHIQQDIIHVKSRVDDLDRYVIADKARNNVNDITDGNDDVVSSSLVGGKSRATTSSLKLTSSREETAWESRMAAYTERMLEQSHVMINKSLESLTSRLDNVTALLAQETKRALDLEKRYKRLQRSLSETSHKVWLVCKFKK